MNWCFLASISVQRKKVVQDNGFQMVLLCHLWFKVPLYLIKSELNLTFSKPKWKITILTWTWEWTCWGDRLQCHLSWAAHLSFESVFTVLQGWAVLHLSVIICYDVFFFLTYVFFVLFNVCLWCVSDGRPSSRPSSARSRRSSLSNIITMTSSSTKASKIQEPPGLQVTTPFIIMMILELQLMFSLQNVPIK